jgi:hypothetical protein
LHDLPASKRQARGLGKNRAAAPPLRQPHPARTLPGQTKRNRRCCGKASIAIRDRNA